MPELNSNEIQKLTESFTLDGISYPFRVGNNFAQSERAAKLGIETIENLPAAVKENVFEALNAGITIFFADGDNGDAAGLWGGDERLRDALLNGKFSLKNRTETYAGIHITVATQSEIPATEILTHEFEHQDWYKFNLIVEKQRYAKLNKKLDSVVNPVTVDPFYIRNNKVGGARMMRPLRPNQKIPHYKTNSGTTVQRSSLTVFFDDFRNYLKKTKLKLSDLKYDPKSPDIIFTGPLTYFETTIVNSELFKKIDCTLITTLVRKRVQAFIDDPKVKFLTGLLKDLRAELPGIPERKIRRELLLAAYQMRAEVGSFFGQINHATPGATLRLAPGTTRLLEVLKNTTADGIERPRHIIYLDHKTTSQRSESSVIQLDHKPSRQRLSNDASGSIQAKNNNQKLIIKKPQTTNVKINKPKFFANQIKQNNTKITATKIEPTITVETISKPNAKFISQRSEPITITVGSNPHYKSKFISANFAPSQVFKFGARAIMPALELASDVGGSYEQHHQLGRAVAEGSINFGVNVGVQYIASAITNAAFGLSPLGAFIIVPGTLNAPDSHDYAKPPVPYYVIDKEIERQVDLEMEKEKPVCMVDPGSISIVNFQTEEQLEKTRIEKLHAAAIKKECELYEKNPTEREEFYRAAAAMQWEQESALQRGKLTSDTTQEELTSQKQSSIPKPTLQFDHKQIQTNIDPFVLNFKAEPATETDQTKPQLPQIIQHFHFESTPPENNSIAPLNIPVGHIVQLPMAMNNILEHSPVNSGAAILNQLHEKKEPAEVNATFASDLNATTDQVNKKQVYVDDSIEVKKEPIFTDFGFVVGSTSFGASLGWGITAYKTGFLKLLFGKTGVLLNAGAKFGPGFWSGFGASVGIGAAIAVPLFVAQAIIKHRHEKIVFRIKRSFKHTKKENQSAKQRLNSLVSRLEENDYHYSEDLLAEVNANLSNFENMKAKEIRRNRQALEYHQHLAAKRHAKIVREGYQPKIDMLTTIKQLLLDDKNSNAIRAAHKEDTAEELFTCLKSATGKTAFTHDDVVAIKTYQNMLTTKLMHLTADDKSDDVKALISEAEKLQYHKPGQFKKFGFTISTKNIGSNKCNEIENDINNAMADIGRMVGEGIDPNSHIDGVIEYINHKINSAINSWEKHDDSKYSQRIKDLENYKKTLIEIKSNYSAGNKPVNLNFGNLPNLFTQFGEHIKEPASFWLDECQQMKSNGAMSFNQLQTEEEKWYAKHLTHMITEDKVLNEVSKHVINDKWHEAKWLLGRLRKEIPETEQTAVDLLKTITFCQNHTNEKPEFWLNLLKEINTEKKSDDANKQITFPAPNSVEFTETQKNLLSDKGDSIIVQEIFNQANEGKYSDAKELSESRKIALPHSKDSDQFITSLQNALSHSHDDEIYWLDYLSKAKTQPASNITRLDSIIASKQLVDLANNYVDLGFYGKAAELLKQLNILEPDPEHERISAQNHFRDEAQIFAMALNPMQSIIVRAANEMEPSERKQRYKNIIEGAHFVQTLLPNYQMLIVQGFNALRTNETKNFTVYAKDLISHAWSDLRDPRNNKMLYVQLGQYFLQAQIENILPKQLGLYVKSFKETILPVTQPALRFASLMVAAGDLWKKGIKSAHAPQLILSMTNAISDLYQYCQENSGNAYEETKSHHQRALTQVAFEGASYAVQLIRIRSNPTWYEYATLLFSAANIYHTHRSHYDDALKSLRGCLSNLSHYDLLKQNKRQSRIFASVVETYIHSNHYLILKKAPTPDQIKSIKSKDYICLALFDSELYLHISPFDNNHLIINLGDASSLINVSQIDWKEPFHGYHEFPDELRTKIRSSIITAYEHHTMTNIKTVLDNQRWGLDFIEYPTKDEEVINQARLVYLEYDVKQRLEDKQYSTILRLTEKVRAFPTLGIINLMCYRLQAMANSHLEILNVPTEFNSYIEALRSSISNEWYSKHWNNCITMFRNVAIFVMKMALINADKEKTETLQKSYVNIILQDFNNCGDWRLLDDEFKFIAARCFLKVNDKKFAEELLKDIKDLFGLLHRKKNKDYTQTALDLLALFDKLKYQSLLQNDNRLAFALTDSILENEAQKLLLNGCYEQAIQWLSSCQSFTKQHYYLASAYYLTNDANLLYDAFKSLFKEDIQDQDYWQLLSHLMIKIINEQQKSELPINIQIDMHAILRICCVKLLTYQLSFDESHAINALIKKTDFCLSTLAMELKTTETTLFKTTNDKYVSKTLDRLQKLMCGNSRQELLPRIETALSIIGFLELDCVVVNDDDIQTSRQLISLRRVS